jgi:hypothetical protein
VTEHSGTEDRLASETSDDATETSTKWAKPISFRDVARMTHEKAAEPDPLLEALLASPARTRHV